MKIQVVATLFFMLFICSTAFSADIFPGYAKIPWGADGHQVVKTFTKGEMAKLGAQDIYKQKNPNKDMAQRTFAFRESKLTAVSVTFSPAYVKKAGIENLLAKHKKLYGEGVIDRSNAPHLVSYKWEDAKTRITFAYAPKRSDMTILMFEKK